MRGTRRPAILPTTENGLFKSIYLLSEITFPDVTICLLEVTTDPLSTTSQTSTHTYSPSLPSAPPLAHATFFVMEVGFGEQMRFRLSHIPQWIHRHRQ